MKVLQFPLAKITLCFMAGIAVCHFANWNPMLVFSCLLFAALLFGIAFYHSSHAPTRNVWYGISAYFLSFTIGIATLTIHNDYFRKDNYIHAVTGDKNQEIEVLLREKLKSSSYSNRYIAVVQSIDSKACSGKILVNLEKTGTNNLQIGSHLRIKAPILKHRKPNNPDQFDYGEYLTNKSVMAQVYAGIDELKISKSMTRDAFYYSDLLRNRILHNLEKNHFHQTELQVIAALVLGQQQDISPEILRDYQFAGAIHILSVSGLHVGFLLLFLNLLLGYLPKSKMTSWLKLGIVIFSLWGFAVLAGLSPSVIRSVTMFSFVAVGMHLKRKTNIFHTLLVSIFLILLFEPSFLFDVGFQLSYVALFFILWLQPMLSKIYAPKNKMVNYFWEILTVSFAAQIGTFPLSIYYFHQFPGLFFVTNLVVIPFLSIIMALGVVVMLLAAFNCVPLLLSQCLEWSVLVLNKIIGWIASFEQFIIHDIPFNMYMLLSLYFLFIATVFCFEQTTFRKISVALIALMLFQGTYFGSRWISKNEKEWIVFNARKSTLIAERDGAEVTVYSGNQRQNNFLLKSYLVANFSHVQNNKPLQNLAFFNSKKIMFIDSTNVYAPNTNPDVLVMRQSPKINLERMLQTVRPKMIVADASNYKSYVGLWKATCQKEKIPFHATAEKGFYKLQ